MKTVKYLALLSAGVSLAACGGGGTTAPAPLVAAPPPPPVTQAPTPTTAVGPISGFGSVIVNGVRYNTDTASFIINGETGTQDDLGVGSYVIVEATVDSSGNATAQSVKYNDAVQGPISSIDTVNNRMVVLGQTVIIDGNTSFDSQITPRSLLGLAVGDNVEISGTGDADGNIIASRIEREPANSEFEVRGIVSNLDTNARTFQINQLTVDYSQAVLEDFGTNVLANGLLVDAEGTNFNNADTLIATKVEYEGEEGRDDDSVGNENDEAEIEGIVTEFSSSSSFKISGVPIITNASTRYEYGTATDIALNVRLEAEGTYNANQVLVAEEIEFKNRSSSSGDSSNDSNIKVETTLDAVNTATNLITIFGVDFEVDASTRYEDDSRANLRTFGLSNLAAGDYLEIKGYDRGGSTLYASKIERDDPEAENESEIEAPVESFTSESLIILGVTVSTNANTRYEDANDNNLSRTAFFNQLRVGDLVEAEGTKTGARALTARELSIELPDDD
ncbi:MAG: hypothetical protein JKY25_05850 [Robiginitomaculum sp.]|nr:hypothetical protein [Robiginitomaculum sp.]